jgi:hypothetical protein
MPVLASMAVPRWTGSYIGQGPGNRFWRQGSHSNRFLSAVPALLAETAVKQEAPEGELAIMLGVLTCGGLSMTHMETSTAEICSAC